MTVSVLREKKTYDLKVTVGELPKELAAARSRNGESSKGDHALAGLTVENASSQSEGFGRSKGKSGVVVTRIDPDSPAERAGLQTGDIIREINRKPVKNVEDFERLTSERHDFSVCERSALRPQSVGAALDDRVTPSPRVRLTRARVLEALWNEKHGFKSAH